MRPIQRDLTSIPAALGLWVTFAGFGLLTLDAAVGVLAIPLGIVLTLVGMERPRPR